MGYHDRLNNPDPHEWPPRRPAMGSDVTRLMAMFQEGQAQLEEAARETRTARINRDNARIYYTRARRRKRFRRLAMAVGCVGLAGLLLFLTFGLYAILLMDQGGR